MLPREYARKAHMIDVKYCDTVPGETGPVESRLRTLGPVRGLVFGSWGEASPDTHILLDAIVAVGARRHRRAMFTSETAAKSALTWMLRRRREWVLDGTTTARMDVPLEKPRKPKNNPDSGSGGVWGAL